jgi:type I restriction enzyme S subunit
MTTPWSTTTIGELFDIGAGKSVTPAARHGEPKSPFLRTANVFWGRIDLTEVDAMHFSQEELKSKTLTKGDLLVCEGGDIGRSAIWKGGVETCSFQNHLHRLRPKSPDVVPYFYMYALQAGFTQLGIYEGAGNKTTIPNLSRNRLAALEVPKPERDEQKKVAAVLQKVQGAIEIEEKLVAAISELKQSTMRQIFARGLRGAQQSETDIGLVPAGWRVDRLVELVYFQRGFDITKKEQRVGVVPVISSGGTKSWHDTPAAKGPGVLLGRKGTIGSVHYVSTDYWPHDTTLWATDFKGNDPLFVYYRLQLLDFERLDSGAANPALNRNYVHDELISWPEDVGEQSEIAQVLAAIARKIDIHERKRTTLQELFRTLLNNLMTEEISVVDLDIDTSDVAIQ